MVIQPCSCVEDRRLVDCQHACRKAMTMMIKFFSTTNFKECSCWLDAWYSSFLSTSKWKYFRNCREARLRRWVSEGQEWAEDVWTFRSRNRTSLHQSVGAKHQEDTSFAGCVCNEMMITRSWRCILTPHCHPQDIQQRIAHILIDIFSNITFSPKMRRWAFSRKNLKRLRRALVQDHLLSFVILN